MLGVFIIYQCVYIFEKKEKYILNMTKSFRKNMRLKRNIVMNIFKMIKNINLDDTNEITFTIQLNPLRHS